MPNDAVQEANRRRQATVDALTVARTREQEIKRRLGFAHSQGLETSAIRRDLTAIREEIEALSESLPVHEETIRKAELEADAERFAPLWQQLDALVAERRATAEELQLLAQDFVASVSKLVHLSNQTVSVARQLGKPGAARASLSHVMPHWLCSVIVPVSPGGAQEWPGVAHPDYARKGIVALNEECLNLGGVA